MNTTYRQLRSPKPEWLILLGLLCLTSLAQAAVRFDVFLGYDGVVSEAGWFPVTCEVQNDGPAFNAVFELEPVGFGQGQVRRMAVELPTGTTKRFVIPVFSANRYTYNWNARLFDERGRVRAEALNKPIRKAVPWQMPLVGAVARTVGGLPVLPEMKSRDRDFQPIVARLQPNLVPDSPIALEGLDMLYLNSEKALELRVTQVNALLAWLHSGGHLVVGVEQVLHINANEWLRPLLPCELASLVTAPASVQLDDWVGDPYHENSYGFAPQLLAPSARRSDAAASTTYENLVTDEAFRRSAMQVATGSVRDGRVLVGRPEQPLVLTAERGRGRLTVLMFSPEMEPFFTWKNRAFFWAKLAGLPPQTLSSQEYQVYGGFALDGVFGAMVDSKQVRKLPVGWLLLLLLGYLVVIGPLDQFWLKKLGKQMFTWLTFPAYVAFFSGLIYLIGYKLRAGETEWNEIHVVDIVPHGEQAELRGRTFASMYSPVNARYKLSSDLPVATLRGEFLGNLGGGRESSQASVAQRGNSFDADIAVPVWTSQLFVSDWWRPDALPLRVSVQTDGAPRQVTVENRLETKMKEARLVLDGRIWELGELPANQTKQFSLTGEGESLESWVQTHGSRFDETAQQRQFAFGSGDQSRIENLPISAMTASFPSLLSPNQAHRTFIYPPGLDLTPLVDRGNAVLLAWAADYAPVKPIYRFSPRRSHRDTLWRMSVAVQ